MNEEKELIENCKKDLSYFTRIYDLYVRDVYRYCYSMTSNKEAAEDAVSYSFLRAIENIKTFEFKDKSIKCWLFIIARNYIYKSRRIPNLSDIDENEPEEDDGILEK